MTSRAGFWLAMSLLLLSCRLEGGPLINPPLTGEPGPGQPTSEVQPVVTITASAEPTRAKSTIEPTGEPTATEASPSKPTRPVTSPTAGATPAVEEPTPKSGPTATPTAGRSEVGLPLPSEEAKAGAFYLVRPGDTLWGISQVAYGEPWLWDLVWAANRDRLPSGPRLIHAGNELWIPDLELIGGEEK